MKFSLLFVITLSFLTLSTAFGRTLPDLQWSIRFSHLSNIQGLSQSTVNAIVQDQQGYIWIGTSAGLNRYDGFDIKIYQSDSSQNTLSNGEVLSLLVDEGGTLWVGTYQGLNRYNQQLDIFTPYQVTTNNNDTLNNQVIRHLYEDKQQNLWIGTTKTGLHVLNEQRKYSQHFEHQKNNPHSLSNNYVYAITEDKWGKLWVGTKKGLNLWDGLDKFKRYFAQEKEQTGLSHNLIRSLYFDDKTLWVGTAQGLNQLDAKTGEFSTQWQNSASAKVLKDKTISAITQGADNKILIGTDSNGLSIFDKNSRHFGHFKHDPQNGRSLTDNNIVALYTDQTGISWVGTQERGIDRFNDLLSQMGHRKSNDSQSQCLSGNNIYALLKDSLNQVWLGVKGKGLHRINLTTGQCTLYNEGATNLTAIKFDNVISLYEDKNKNIWIGDLNEGVVRYHRTADKFEHFKPDNKQNPNLSIHSTAINRIAGDKKGNIWIATYPRGISQFDVDNNRFTNYLPANSNEQTTQNSIVDAEIINLAPDHQGTLWLLTTKKGLSGLNLNDNQFFNQPLSLDNPDLIPTAPMSIKTDNVGNVWIGTVGNGVYKVNPKANSYRHYSFNHGFASNTAYFIEQDNEHNLWFSTSNGISRLDTTTDEFKNYTFDDGLQHNEFTIAGFFDKKANELWFGGINGYNRFSPSKLTIDPTPPKLSITQFDLFNQKVNISTKQAPTVLKSAIQTVKSIDLDYNQNVFSFGFVAHHYAAPEQNQYAFQLQNYDGKFNYTDASKRIASYTNLDPGHYIFRVKAANKDGVWSQQETVIEINIATPPWHSWWAYSIYAIILLGSPILIHRYRTKQIRQRANKLEKQVVLRTQELRQKNQQVENLLSQKSEEFSNVSHEFRTPLTLILGSVKSMLRADIAEPLKDKMKIAQRNSYRLVRMVDQLLQLEKFNVQRIFQPTPHAVKPIVSLIAQSFDDLAKERQIKLNIEQIDDIWLEFTADALEKITLNLLSNALKYSQPNDTVSINARLVNNNDFELCVKDTGIGISLEKQRTIFDKFSRAEEEHREKITGAGIGLALVKKLVESHGGTITVQSQLGQGSTFKVLLPNAQSHAPENITTNINTEMLSLELESLVNQKNVATIKATSLIDKQDAQATLLVIEDNVDMRNYIIQSLGDKYHCIEAENGRQGVEKAREEIPDLIISDIMMPIMDGYEVSNQLKNDAKTSHIPLILLSARGDRQSRLKGWQEYADEYIVKPFDEEELLLRVENLLAIRALLSQRLQQELLQPPSKDTLLDKAKPTDDTTTDDTLTPQSNLAVKEREFIDNLTAILEKQFANHQLKIGQIASEMCMSETQFYRKLKSLLNVTPNAYLRTFRLQKSAKLLVAGQIAGEVAYSVGFSSHAYFSTCFKAYFGLTPSEYCANEED